MIVFTGIIEEKGTIENVHKNGEAMTVTIRASKILNDIHLGDSIAINGVCLTVTSYNTRLFSVDIMPETFRATSLKMITRGVEVNLERAMAAGGRFGGHFVSGHVDGIGKIIKKNGVDNAVYYSIQVSEELMNYIILKGSIAVDGTSLTVFGVEGNSFIVSLIPHTLSETVLGNKGVGNIVNIECDMLGKYIEQFLSKRFENNTDQESSGITDSFLRSHGFKS